MGGSAGVCAVSEIASASHVDAESAVRRGRRERGGPLSAPGQWKDHDGCKTFVGGGRGRTEVLLLDLDVRMDE